MEVQDLLGHLALWGGQHARRANLDTGPQAAVLESDTDGLEAGAEAVEVRVLAGIVPEDGAVRPETEVEVGNRLEDRLQLRGRLRETLLGPLPVDCHRDLFRDEI